MGGRSGFLFEGVKAGRRRREGSYHNLYTH